MKNYLSLVKFSHTVFALPFAVIGFFIAVKLHHYQFNPKIFILVIICMIAARNAAMAFNRYLDREIDKKNPRTAVREIPSGKISSSQALIFTIINALVFISSTFFLNRLVFFLSPVALAVILGYSYTKRFTPLCHLILGLGLSLAPVGAYLAVTAKFHVLPVLLGFSVLFWVSGFDIIYALQDESFDKANNLYSIPAALGKVKALRLSRILHGISFIFLLTAGHVGNFSYYYYIGVAIFGIMLVYQHTLVKPDDLRKVNLAFFTTNGVSSVVFAIFVLLDLFVS
ncbi:MAG: 4-hydroxybenzoate octaprenyltransferase [Bacteroidetes bacterium]|nr:MAG: 4-hydroxybenzoate octaprenyltransferase [Bacteroidota bacterium]